MIDIKPNPIVSGGDSKFCKDDCDEYFGCHSFKYCPGHIDDGNGCFMYDKKITKDDQFFFESTKDENCETHYRECAGNAMHLL